MDYKNKNFAARKKEVSDNLKKKLLDLRIDDEMK